MGSSHVRAGLADEAGEIASKVFRAFTYGSAANPSRRLFRRRFEQYDLTSQLSTNLTLADLWHRGMGVGASSSSIAVQYCMPYPNDILSSVLNEAATNIRATDDYFHGDDPYESNWPIGQVGMLIHALGALPFKDGFYSSNLPQLGGATAASSCLQEDETEDLLASFFTFFVSSPE